MSVSTMQEENGRILCTRRQEGRKNTGITLMALLDGLAGRPLDLAGNGVLRFGSLSEGGLGPRRTLPYPKKARPI